MQTVHARGYQSSRMQTVHARGYQSSRMQTVHARGYQDLFTHNPETYFFLNHSLSQTIRSYKTKLTYGENCKNLGFKIGNLSSTFNSCTTGP